jgi:integrase
VSFAKNLGVGATFHDLRHSHASELIAIGVDARTVGNHMGRSTVADRRAADSFEDLVREPAPRPETEAVSWTLGATRVPTAEQPIRQ